MSQNRTVLKHLREQGSITARYAGLRYGIFRLSARVQDLRDNGVQIDTKMHENEAHPGPIGDWAEYRYKGERQR